jgi:CDGSH-type Zn-finger protein
VTEPVAADTRPQALELEPGDYWWCACGRSGNQPFCDGSHRDTGITPHGFSVQEKKKGFYCMCKRTGNPPYCDGSHQALASEA